MLSSEACYVPEAETEYLKGQPLFLKWWFCSEANTYFIFSVFYYFFAHLLWTSQHWTPHNFESQSLWSFHFFLQTYCKHFPFVFPLTLLYFNPLEFYATIVSKVLQLVLLLIGPGVPSNLYHTLITAFLSHRTFRFPDNCNIKSRIPQSWMIKIFQIRFIFFWNILFQPAWLCIFPLTLPPFFDMPSPLLPPSCTSQIPPPS